MTEHLTAKMAGSLAHDGLLRDCWTDFEHPSLHRRLRLLLTLVHHISSAAELDPISNQETKVLVRLLLSAVCNPQYLERLWLKGLDDLIASATRSKRCPTFTPMCATRIAGEQVPSSDLIYSTAYSCCVQPVCTMVWTLV